MIDPNIIFSGDDRPEFSKMANQARIDVNAKLRPQPICISIGEHSFGGTRYPSTFGSYGDYSCIVGASKSKKSFVKSAIAAAYFGGRADSFFPEIKGHETAGKWLIDIDTEQSDYHAQRVFRRIPEMVGQTPNNYVGFALRRYTPNERQQFVEWLIYESQYRGKIGLISIDGYADLISDFNDIEQSNELTSNLLKWSHDANCHITGILHKNFGSEKPVGHIGSAVLKKAETVAFTVPTTRQDGTIDFNAPVKLECRYSRNIPFDEFWFEIRDNLPVQAEQPIAGGGVDFGF